MAGGPAVASSGRHEGDLLRATGKDLRPRTARDEQPPHLGIRFDCNHVCELDDEQTRQLAGAAPSSSTVSEWGRPETRVTLGG
jgi:hypothetical protein